MKHTGKILCLFISCDDGLLYLFIDEETEAAGSEVTCSKSHG